MKKLHAIIFILLGFTGGAGSLLSQYIFCLNNWNNDYKALAFDTFWDYFISVSGGAILYSVMFAFLPPFILLVIWGLNRLVRD